MALWFPVRKIISYPHLVCNVFFYRLHHCSQIKNLRIPKNSGDSRESNQVKINQVLCCILTISRFYIGQADVTVNLGGSQISMPKNRCHTLFVHPSDQQVCGRQLHNQQILYQICRLFIYPAPYGIYYLLYNACPDIHTIHLQKISCKPCDDMLP